jgi:Ca-activated chloride channel homolog
MAYSKSHLVMNFLKSIEWPQLLIILIFIVLSAFFIYKYYRISKELDVNFSNIILKLILRVVYFSLFIIALLGPSFGETKREIKAIGKDIFICVDLSTSMNATDIQPSRLERMKFELRNIVNAFNSDRIGLIIFSSEAFVQCPLTFDQSAISLFIETLNTGLLPVSSTDFGPPLDLALNKFSENDTVPSKQSKAIVFISDGEDFGTETDEIADEIEKKGVRLFSLGIGTAKGSKIPLPGGGYKRDKKGDVVVSTLNSESLKKLAINTGGKYFEINENDNGVPRLISAINQIEGEVRDVRKVDASANKYFYFLVVAFALLLADIMISTKAIAI